MEAQLQPIITADDASERGSDGEGKGEVLVGGSPGEDNKTLLAAAKRICAVRSAAENQGRTFTRATAMSTEGPKIVIGQCHLYHHNNKN